MALACEFEGASQRGSVFFGPSLAEQCFEAVVLLLNGIDRFRRGGVRKTRGAVAGCRGHELYPQFNSVSVAAPERDYRTDIEALAARAGERTKLCFLANPNNPTGTYVTATELKRLRALLPAHVLLVVDAAYAEYVVRNDYSAGAELVDAGDNVVMTRTFSKIHGLASLRIGWMYAPEAICDIVNRIRGPFNLSGPALAAGAAAINDNAHVEMSAIHNEKWLDWLTQATSAREHAAGRRGLPADRLPTPRQVWALVRSRSISPETASSSTAKVSFPAVTV